MFPTFFPPPRHRVHSEKYIRREKERRRKKRQAGKLAVCTRGFLSGRRRVAQEIRWNFAQNEKRAAGVLGYANSEIRDFMNDKATGWAASSSKGRSDNAMEKDRDNGKEGEARRASERASRLPPGRIINFRRTRNPFNILSETLQSVSWRARNNFFQRVCRRLPRPFHPRAPCLPFPHAVLHLWTMLKVTGHRAARNHATKLQRQPITLVFDM